jgi:type I restriction enzyme S subunit
MLDIARAMPKEWPKNCRFNPKTGVAENRYLKATTSDLERAIAAAHSEISLLREYRTRLIADVVTGSLDVRAAAAALPEEDEEPEALEEAPDEVEEVDESIPEGEEIEV